MNAVCFGLCRSHVRDWIARQSQQRPSAFQTALRAVWRVAKRLLGFICENLAPMIEHFCVGSPSDCA